MRLTLLIPLLLTCGLGAADQAPDPAKIQAAMAKMSTTGAEHAGLAKAVGTWDVQSTMWMAPGAPPQVSKGTATFTAVLGGKWFRQDYSGEMMGQPYTGVGLSGYDTTEGRYVATWMDSFSTSMSKMDGASTDGGTTITYTSHLEHCPMTGGPLTTRSVLTWTAPERMTFTMFNTPEGGTEVKSMELIYTRTAGAKK